MASEITIVNQALTHLGSSGRPLLSLTEENPRARVANQLYAQTRDTLLSEHPWKFATKRVNIAADVAAPLFEFARQFEVPSDYLGMVNVDYDGKIPWRKEGSKILTDGSSPLPLIYTSRVEAVDLMPHIFRECLAARLAVEMSIPLTRTQSVADTMNALYSRKLAIAKVRGAHEEPPDEIQSTTWIDARY